MCRGNIPPHPRIECGQEVTYHALSALFFAFLTAAVCTVLLYCLYLKAPDPLTRALAPRNGSPWELGKLAFWSMLPAALVLHHLGPAAPAAGCVPPMLLSAVLAAALTPLGLPPLSCTCCPLPPP